MWAGAGAQGGASGSAGATDRAPRLHGGADYAGWRPRIGAWLQSNGGVGATISATAAGGSGWRDEQRSHCGRQGWRVGGRSHCRRRRRRDGQRDGRGRAQR